MQTKTEKLNFKPVARTSNIDAICTVAKELECLKDTVLKCGQEKFLVHGVLFAAYSSFVACALKYCSNKSNRHFEVNMDNVTTEMLSSVVKFVYQSQQDTLEDELKKEDYVLLHTTACFLDMPDLIEVCTKKICNIIADTPGPSDDFLSSVILKCANYDVDERLALAVVNIVGREPYKYANLLCKFDLECLTRLLGLGGFYFPSRDKTSIAYEEEHMQEMLKFVCQMLPDVKSKASMKNEVYEHLKEAQRHNQHGLYFGFPLDLCISDKKISKHPDNWTYGLQLHNTAILSPEKWRLSAITVYTETGFNNTTHPITACLSVEYENHSTKEIKLVEPYPCDGFTFAKRIELDIDEFVTHISYSAGWIIDDWQFHTNKGRVINPVNDVRDLTGCCIPDQSDDTVYLPRFVLNEEDSDRHSETADPDVSSPDCSQAVAARNDVIPVGLFGFEFQTLMTSNLMMMTGVRPIFMGFSQCRIDETLRTANINENVLPTSDS